MATLCIRSTDCLAGRASFVAHRGVRAAPAPTPRLPMQQQSQHENLPHVAMNSRSARPRANGQRRRRRSPPAAGAGAGDGDRSPPQKRVMENVVILRRGQTLMNREATAPLTATASAAGPSVGQAAPEKAETALAGKDADAGVAPAARRGELEKVDESVPSAKQSSAEAEKCEAAAAGDQRGTQDEAVTADSMGTGTKEEEEAVVTTNQSGAETTEDENEPEAAADQRGAQAETGEQAAAVGQRGPGTREKEAEAAEHRGADAMRAEHAPAARQTLPLPLAKEEVAEQAYSGASFAAVAPDPRALPIPGLLLKPRGMAARIRVHAPDADNDGAPAPTAAAA